MTREEVQQKVLKEMMKRIGPEEFMTNMMETIQLNVRIMQEILDENPEWGYKIIINDKYFKLIRTQ